MFFFGQVLAHVLPAVRLVGVTISGLAFFAFWMGRQRPSSCPPPRVSLVGLLYFYINNTTMESIGIDSWNLDVSFKKEIDLYYVNEFVCIVNELIAYCTF